MTPLGSATVLLVGMGGLGCPAAWALAAAGVGRLRLLDDDHVEASNLHRQILYGPGDVGSHKLEAAARTLRERFPALVVETVVGRLLPETARELVRAADLVVEGADNHATKFLAADACHLERRPVVHGAAIRWVGTALAVRAGARPCYRCLFEDLPAREASERCAEAGVMGPVTGVVGACMAELALALLLSGEAAAGTLFTYDGLRDRLRRRILQARGDCPLCGDTPLFDDVAESRYLAPSSAARPPKPREETHP